MAGGGGQTGTYNIEDIVEGGGCSCRAAASESARTQSAGLLLGLAAMLIRRRKR
jgi:MYXO-CTERM domain-containing protein